MQVPLRLLPPPPLLLLYNSILTSKAQIDAVPCFAGSPESISTSEPSTTPPAMHFGLPPLPDEGGDAIPLPKCPPPPSPSSTHGNLKEKPPIPAPSPEPIPDLPVTPPPQSPTPLPVTPPTAGVPRHRFLDLYHYLPLLEVSVLQPVSPLHGSLPPRKASYARECSLAHLRSVRERYQ
jgi:hypothetical protein